MLPRQSSCLFNPDMMLRENMSELLERPDIPDELVRRAYQDLAKIHHWLGDIRFVVTAIRRDPLPVSRILDIGCGTGAVLEKVRQRLGAEVIGADIRVLPRLTASFPIVRANAVHDPLPCADIAFSMHLGHHLCESDLGELIRNVSRYCRRFILLDLVRHPLPLALFRKFVAPFVCSIDAEDGQRSIRRSYTPSELSRITASALDGTAGRFRLSVAPFYIRQVVDISYQSQSLCFVEGEVRHTGRSARRKLYTPSFDDGGDQLTAVKSQAWTLKERGARA